MAYVPKPAAPVSFNAIDALLSFVHNDPVWGWLEGWVHLYPNQYFETATFCAQGPTNAAPLNLGDLLNVFPPGNPDWLGAQQATDAKVIGALHDRLFGAMCNLSVPGTSWSSETCIDTVSSTGGERSIQLAIPVGATAGQMQVVGHSGSVDSLQFFIWSNVPGGGDGVAAGAWGDGVAEPSAWINLPGPWANIATYGGIWQANSYVAGSAHICFRFQGLGDEPYVPVDQPQPAGYVPRDVPPVAGFSDLAPLLFNIENKLETLLPIAAGTLTNQLDTGVASPDDPIPVVPGVPITIANWLGFVVTLSGVIDEADVGFGQPQELARVGRVTVGSAEGWYPSIQITHTPLVVRPMPPGATRLAVIVRPNATATVTPILPA